MYEREGGEFGSLLTQGHPWATIVSDVLKDADGLSDVQRKQMVTIAGWTHYQMAQAPNTLAIAPGYILSESLIAIAMRVSSKEKTD
jgi:hypothetical protein